MKARINLILCLLLIAITTSLIAVSFGWYAAEAGSISVEDSSVTVVTSDTDFYVGGANFEFVTTMSRAKDENFDFIVHNKDKMQPYYGEDGIFSGEYIILVRIDKNADIIPEGGAPFIEHVDLYLTYLEEYKYRTSYTSITEYQKDFQLLYVNYNETEKTATEIARDAGVTPEYIAIIFGDGKSIFKYSSNQYLGYKFAIYMNYDTEIKPKE